MRIACAVCLVLVTSVPAVAENVFQRPPSCERLATAQNNDCEVMNIFACQTDSDLTHRYEINDEAAEPMVVLWHDQTDLLSVHVPWTEDGLSVTIKGPSVAAAIAAKSANLTASGEVTMMGMKRDVTGQARYVFDGQTVELAGQTFQLVAAEIEAYPPYPMEPLTGSVVVAHSDALKLSVPYESKLDLDLEGEVSRLSTLSLPGQDGFGVEIPTVGCRGLSYLSFTPLEVPA